MKQKKRTRAARKVRRLVRPEIPREILAEFDACVRRRFAVWQKAHPGFKVSSMTIRDPIQLMLAAMSCDIDSPYDKDVPNNAVRGAAEPRTLDGLVGGLNQEDKR
jgi:hypothetical protein